MRLTPVTDALHGVAAYDSAISLFHEGGYQSSAEAFRGLLNSHTSPGYDMRQVSLWLRPCTGLCWIP